MDLTRFANTKSLSANCQQKPGLLSAKNGARKSSTPIETGGSKPWTSGRLAWCTSLIAQLTIRLNLAPVPATGLTIKIDDRWTVTIANKETVRSAGGVEVPPFCVYIEFNGWPAGIINPFEGSIVAGEAANEDALIAALQARLAE